MTNQHFSLIFFSSVDLHCKLLCLIKKGEMMLDFHSTEKKKWLRENFEIIIRFFFIYLKKKILLYINVNIKKMRMKWMMHVWYSVKVLFLLYSFCCNLLVRANMCLMNLKKKCLYYYLKIKYCLQTNLGITTE